MSTGDFKAPAEAVAALPAPRSGQIWAYLLAVAATAATLGGRLAFAAWFGDRPVLVIFVLPIIFSAYVGGLGPGLVATATVGLGTSYFLIPPLHSFAMERSVDTVQWLILVLIGVLISVLTESLHAARRNALASPTARRSLATERKVQAGFGLALTFLVVIGAVSVLSVARLREATGWATHTEKVIASLRLLLSTLTDVETAERGFVITGEEIYLGPYDAARRLIDGEMAGLRQLTADNRIQQTELDRLEPLVTARLALAEQIITRRRHEGQVPAQTLLAAGVGKEVHDRIRALLAKMEATEQGLLRDRENRAQHDNVITRTVIIAGGTLAFVFVAVALFIMNQEFTRRRRVESALREAQENLEARVRERTAELGRTNEALQASEDLFAKAFRLSPDCIAIVRLADRTVVKANEALCHLWGTTMEKVVGQPTANFASWLSEEHRQGIMQILLAEGELLNFETEMRLSNGRLIRFLVSTRLITLDHETCMLSIMSDITERKRAEIALAHLAAIVEFSDDAIIGKDLGGIVTSWNDGAQKIFGYTADEMIGQPITRIIPTDRRSEEAEILGQVRQGESVRHFDTLRQRKDGRLINISVTVSAIRDATGQVVGASKVARDITDQKRAEQALKDSNERFASMFNSSPVATTLTTIPDGEYLDVNDAFLKLFEVSRPEVIGHNVFELNTWMDLGQRDALFAQIKEHGVVHGFDMTLRTRSGRLIQLLWSGVQVVIDGQTCLLGSGLDFTERRRIEQALRDNDALLHATDRRLAEMVQGMTEACITLDRDWRFTFVNDRCETLFRRSRAEVLGRPIWDVFPQLIGAPAEQHYRRVMAERIPDAYEVFSPVAERWIDTRLFPTPDGLAAFMMDISGRKEAELGILKNQEEIRLLNATLEKRVAERTAELSDLYNNAPCGYHSLDDNGLFVGLNDTELDWLGYEREELVGKRYATDLLSPRSAETFRKNYPHFLATGKLDNLEMEMIRKDGSILTVLLSATSVVDDAGRFLRSRSTIIDYTERKRIDNALTATRDGLEAANRELEAFSYSVSHDLRTPLRAVDGFSQAVLEDYGATLPAEGQRYLRTIRESAQRMAELIDDLLLFSRLSRQALQRRPVDTAQLVRSALSELHAQRAGREVEIKTGALPACDGDPALLKQVWINLLSNALKYTRRRPQASVEIGAFQRDGADVFFVRDNGTGFDMQYAHKLFGVFQRLHRAEDYEGTGVGLAIVQRIIHRHGGRVWAEATLDGGATFFFTLGLPPV